MLDKASTPLTVVAFLLNPVSLLFRLWAGRRYHVKNDAWYKRGLITIAVAAVAAIVMGTGPVAWYNSVLDVLYAFGDRSTMAIDDAVVAYLLAGLPFSVAMVGVASMLHSYHYEYAARRFLNATRPTVRMKLRKLRNQRRLRKGTRAGGKHLTFGLIADDPIPWRTPRHGMVVERPVKRFGHGQILGATGTGKTVLASGMAYQFAAAGGAVVYIDCKASQSTLNAMRGAADKADVPFHQFNLGVGSAGSWYDPLGGGDSPAVKASMLIESFHFPEEGAASFYRGAAEAWLPMQFEVLDAVGLRAGESQFDFLLDTATPEGLRRRIEPLASGGSTTRELHTAWGARIRETNADHLTNLRNNLTKIVNSAGSQLRPSGGAPPLSMTDVADRGGIVYIGLSAATDDTALKVIGSLAIRDLTLLAGARANEDTTTLRPVLSFVDEASRLGSRAAAMEDLYATARESDIYVWTISQSYAAWPTTTVKEMIANAASFAVFRIQDDETALTVTNSLGAMPALDEMREEKIVTHSFRETEVSPDGDGRSSLTSQPFLRADQLLSLPDQHAHIWFTGSTSSATRRRRRSRRVRHEQVTQDAPLVRIVPASIVLPGHTPPPHTTSSSSEPEQQPEPHPVMPEPIRRTPPPHTTNADEALDRHALTATSVTPLTDTQRATLNELRNHPTGNTPPPPPTTTSQTRDTATPGATFLTIDHSNNDEWE